MTAFTAIKDATKNISASTTSGSVAFDAPILPTGGVDMLVVNGGTTVAFVCFGNGTQTATSANIPIPGGGHRVIHLNNLPSNPITHAGAIMASGAATIYFAPGQGGSS